MAHHPPAPVPAPIYTPPDPTLKPRQLLIIDSPEMDWASVFQGATLPCGSPVEVFQCEWQHLSFTSYFEHGQASAVCSVRSGDSRQMCKPEMLLSRNEVQSLPPHDFRNLLMGLRFAQVPAVNSLESLYGMLERPWAFAELIRLQQKLGQDKFPLIPQYYYPSHREMNFTPEYPIVVKVAHGQAGYGKMKLHDCKGFQDLGSVMAMSTAYCTSEPFLTGEYDIRIQKIGPHYRAWKRVSISGEWKTNTGTSMVSPLELTEQYKLWADEASQLFGGMDILSVDAVHTVDGNEYILEVNGSSSGFMPEVLEQDNAHVRELVLQRMQEHYPLGEPADGQEGRSVVELGDAPKQ